MNHFLPRMHRRHPMGGKVDGNTEAANAGWFRSDVEGANQGTLLQNRAGFAQPSRVREIADS